MTDGDEQVKSRRHLASAALLRRRLGGQVDSDRPCSGITALPKARTVRASMGQERLAFLQSLEPESPFYNAYRSWRIRGDLNVTALKQAIAGIVRRHSVLNSRLHWNGGLLELCPGEDDNIPIQFVDLTAHPEAHRESAARNEVEHASRKPFDLADGPPIRVLIVRVSEADHVLFITMHHTACDGWSFGIIHRELALLYASLCRGEVGTLPAPGLQYADYAAWQRSRWQPKVDSPCTRHWKRRLSGYQPNPDLPTDFPRPAKPGFRGARVILTIERQLRERLKALALTEQTTLFSVLMATFKCLLHRYTGQLDLLVGTPVANRKHAELQSMVGLVVSSLVLRSSFEGDPSFRDFLRQIRDRCMEDFAHADVPFEWLVAELDAGRRSDRNPLFQSAFAFQNLPDRDLIIDGLQIEPFGHSSATHACEGNGTAKFDLTLSLWPTGDRLEGFLEYDVDLFRRDTATTLSSQFLALLEGAVEDPESPISRLPMEPLDRQHRALALSLGPMSACPREEGIHRIFEAVARHHPDAVALSYGGRTVPYEELNRKGNQLAHWLRRLGVRSGARIGVLMDRSEIAVVAILGILKAGCAYVPLNPADPVSRLSQLVGDARLEQVLANAGSLEVGLPLPASVQFIDGVDAQWRTEDHRELDLAVGGESPAYVMFTSGSTGKPKGVVIPHRAVLRLVLGVDYIDFGPDQTHLLLAPLSFDASTFELWAALLHGGRCALYTDRLPAVDALEDTLVSQGVTTLFLTTSLFNLIVETNPSVLRNVRQLLTGGEMLSVPHVRRALDALPRTSIFNAYGPTESTTFATTYRIPRELSADTSSIPIGRPIANTGVYILDQAARPVAYGVPGEIYIAGDGLALGYLDDPLRTDERFVSGCWSDDAPQRLYRTGDRARRRPDGEIEFLGRVDHQVKIRGFRVEPGEIEFVLRAQPQVADCVVVATTGANAESRLIAYFVPAGSQLADPSTTVRDVARTKLPSYMVPSAFVPLPALPTNANGKLDRAALPAVSADEFRIVEDGLPSPGSLEELISILWAEALGVDRVGLREDFFRLGGHSLMAMQLTSQISEQLGVRLDLQAFFENASVEELANHLRSDPGRAATIDGVLAEIGVSVADSFGARHGQFMNGE